MKVYGPYTRPDGRQHVILIFEDGQRRTVSYPKYLMEQKLGRELDPDLETINHKNGDFTDNRWENLEILSRVDHAHLDGYQSGHEAWNKGEEYYQHGTVYAWMKKKCRCEVCYPVWRKWHDERNAKRRKK